MAGIERGLEKIQEFYNTIEAAKKLSEEIRRAATKFEPGKRGEKVGEEEVDWEAWNFLLEQTIKDLKTGPKLNEEQTQLLETLEMQKKDIEERVLPNIELELKKAA